jgi:DHA2 family multidrug resistance protein
MAATAETVRSPASVAPAGENAPAGGSGSLVEYGARRLIVVAGVMLSALLQTLDSTITNVALPNIQGSLGASPDEGTWVINGYTIAVVIVIPMIPWLQITFGRKRYFLTCIAGFTAASFLCGISGSISELILFRVVQGVFGAGLLATGQTILRDTFPADQLGVSQGIFAIGAIMGPALGPPLGGVLVDNANWNWVFDINVVPGIASFLILLAFLRDPDKAQREPLDVFGLIFLVVGIGSLQYVLSEGNRWDWFSDTNNVIFACAAVLGIGALIWHETHTERPLVDLRIFRFRAVWAGFLLALVIGGAIFGSTYALPQLVQNSLGFTATLSGVLIFMRAIPIGIATPFIARFAGRVDTRIFMAPGFILLGLGNVLQANVTTAISGFSAFVIPLMMTGIGAALLFIPLTTAVLGGVPRDQGPRASAYTNLAVQLGGSIAIAALSTEIERRTALHLSELAGTFVPGSTHLATIPNAPAHAQQFLDLASGQATVLAFADASLLIAGACFISVALVFLMPHPRGGAVKGKRR